MSKSKQLQLRLCPVREPVADRIAVMLSGLGASIDRAISARISFWRKKLLVREYIPLYIAFLVFITISAISASVVVFDANSHITSYRKMQQLFLDSGYDLPAIRRGEADVPRVFIQTLPSDFNMTESTGEKKDLFIKFLLPLVLKVNENLRADRERLITIKSKLDAGKKPTEAEKAWLALIRQEYKTKDGSPEEILVKLDEIPVSMALGMAAEETGWGESRFLLHGNAIFAEWTWSGDGMKPWSRKNGLIHKVKSFPSLTGSVQSFASNLNKTRYYAGFRRMRAEMRKAGKPLRGDTLMSAMVRYSTRKDQYILGVKKIIRDNSLNDFNGARLAPEAKQEDGREPATETE